MQFASTLLEIGIGMIAVYIALSLAVSWINEQIATVVSLRGKTLADGIKKMLDDDKTHAAFFSHPLITSSATTAAMLPSYLTSRQFASTLLDVINATPAVAGDARQAFADLTTDVSTLAPGQLKTTLTTFLNKSAGDYHAFVLSVEAWFDATMDRISGLYRRLTTLIILGIGVVLVGLLNADSIRLFENFQCNSAVRTSIVSASIPAAKDGTPGDAVAALSKTVFSSLPFSWYTDDSSPVAACQSAAQNKAHEGREPPVVKILGLLLTVVAISLGAPFWFDTLKLVMNVRNAGAVPNSSTSAGSS